MTETAAESYQRTRNAENMIRSPVTQIEIGCNGVNVFRAQTETA